MDLYKLISLILILNLGLTAATVFVIDSGNWEQFVGKEATENMNTLAQNIKNTMTDEDKMLTEQGENKQEYNGGISITMLALPILFSGIFAALFGALIAVGGMVLTAFIAENTVVSIVAYMCAMFIVMLYIWLAMKIWTWFYSKDTQ